MKWQPIETAPKTDSVLLWNGVRVFEGSINSGVWWSEFDMGDYEQGMPEAPQPTHWMPLPEPPRK